VSATENAHPALVEHYFRHEYGRLVGSLARGFGIHRLAAIEDAVQSAMLTALTSWGLSGVPPEPGAWLQQVARNRLIDELRRERVGGRILAVDRAASPAHAPSEASVSFVDEIPDPLLRMLFICSDEALPLESQLALALKILCGFSTREIALRLMTTEANVQKRLSRGRERLATQVAAADAGVLDTPPMASLAPRLSSVLQTVYLMFTSGYSSADAEALVRRDLCDEALRLGQLLVQHPAGDAPASWALLALMTMQAARLDARVDEQGGLLLLDQQDRSRWDWPLIERGLAYLGRSASGDTFTRYHAEAAVLAEHCRAPSFAETRWREIASLYEMLEQLAPSPVHTLNRAVAIAEADGPAAGLAILRALTPPAWLQKYYLWDATVGELERRAGNPARAEAALARALESAPTDAERALIRRRLELARRARAEAGDEK
jgi:RNA polymerase sigma-70 factor (ECF subfamily)